MRFPRVTIVAAIAAAVLWAAKAVSIGVFGHDSYDDPVASALFLLGLLAFVIAVLTAAWSAMAGKHVGLRVLACLGAVLVTVGFSAATTPVFESVIDSWVGAELNLWILAVVLLMVVAVGHRDDPHQRLAGPEARRRVR